MQKTPDKGLSRPTIVELLVAAPDAGKNKKNVPPNKTNQRIVNEQFEQKKEGSRNPDR